MKSHIQLLARGLLFGFVTAFLVAAIPTILDWYGNHGTIFRDSTGTNWIVVFETFVSWLWPVFLVSAPVSIAVLAFISYRKSNNAT